MSIIESLAGKVLDTALKLVGDVERITHLEVLAETEQYEPFVTAWFDPNNVDELVK